MRREKKPESFGKRYRSKNYHELRKKTVLGALSGHNHTGCVERIQAEAYFLVTNCKVGLQ